MSGALSEVVAGRLVGTMHRLFQRSGTIVKEPMLHPTPYLFLYDHYVEKTKHTAGAQLAKSEDASVPVSIRQYIPIEPSPYSVALEAQVTNRVHQVIEALDKAGYDCLTLKGLEKLEDAIQDKNSAVAKIINDLELTGANTTAIQVDKLVFYNMLGTKDRYMGGMRDGELYSETLKESWKTDGFAVEFPKGAGTLVTPQIIHGKALGDKVEKYTQKLYEKHQQVHKNRYGGVMMGALFFFMGIYTMYWQWQWIAYRELERQRFKLSMRMLDSDAPQTEGQKNVIAKHKEFLLSYYEDDEEEEEDDEEEDEEDDE